MYSTAVQKETFPSVNQAIIFPHLDGVPAQYYAKKIVSIIGNNVLHCAKISNNRVRMYIKTREIAENFLKSGGEIEINGQISKARWYKQERNDKKIIISNVPPHVPHEEITKKMAAHGVIPTSPMRFLRLTQEEGLTNILSERRYVYIPAESAEKLPSSELIKFDDDEYRAFYNDSLVKCFICHQTGHTTQACEYNKDRNENVQHKADKTPEMEYTDSDVIKISNPPNKRTLSEITPSSSNSVTEEIEKVSTAEIINNDALTNNTEQPKKKTATRKNKKMKTDNEPISINVLLKPIEENYQAKNEEYPISFTNFRLMMDMVKGQADPISTIMQFTDDIQGVVKTLEENYPFLDTRSMKTRFTKLKNKILNVTQDGSSSESNSETNSENKNTSQT